MECGNGEQFAKDTAPAWRARESRPRREEQPWTRTDAVELPRFPQTRQWDLFDGVKEFFRKPGTTEKVARAASPELVGTFLRDVRNFPGLNDPDEFGCSAGLCVEMETLGGRCCVLTPGNDSGWSS